MTNSVDKLENLYVNEVMRLYGVSVSIVSYRDPKFTSCLWTSFLGIKLNLSMAFYHQTNGKSERTIQILEDLLKACILEFSGNWEDLKQQLPSYNRNESL